MASTIIGVTHLAQLDECIDAWGTQLSPELLQAIDQIRWGAKATPPPETRPFLNLIPHA